MMLLSLWDLNMDFRVQQCPFRRRRRQRPFLSVVNYLLSHLRTIIRLRHSISHLAFLDNRMVYLSDLWCLTNTSAAHLSVFYDGWMILSVHCVDLLFDGWYSVVCVSRCMFWYVDYVVMCTKALCVASSDIVGSFQCCCDVWLWIVYFCSICVKLLWWKVWCVRWCDMMVDDVAVFVCVDFCLEIVCYTVNCVVCNVICGLMICLSKRVISLYVVSCVCVYPCVLETTSVCVCMCWYVG